MKNIKLTEEEEINIILERITTSERMTMTRSGGGNSVVKYKDYKEIDPRKLAIFLLNIKDNEGK